MKKLALTLVALLMAAIPAFSERVTIQTAQHVAQSFLNSKMGGNPKIHLIDFAEKSSFPNFYVFGNERCFVIIAADDCVHPVMGYSTEGGFGTIDMPDAVGDWLKSYDKEIELSVKNGLNSDDEIQSEWKCLVCGDRLEPKSRTSVAPMIRTQWNQTAPYNTFCPVDQSGPNGHAYTGCIATAMAQIMKYWEHPIKGLGSHSYIPTSHPEYGMQSVNFGGTDYDWDNMRNRYSLGYSDTEVEAVATLMFHCGVAVNMMYGPNGSSAYLDSAMIALRTYFNYYPGMYREYKSFPYNGGTYIVHSDDEWKGMLKNELNNSRPMIYQGAGVGSHAFVCDGYDEYDFFHFNWGWGGGYDGYYAINSLNPNNHDYSNSNAAIFGCMPNAPSINPPSNVCVIVNGRNVEISWSRVGDASYYRVYRDGELIVNNVTGTSYTDIEVVYGLHSYYVKSVKLDGAMSLKSNIITADVHFTGPVSSNLQGSSSNHGVNLTWNAPESESAALQYGVSSFVNCCGYNGNSDFYWAQRFPSSTLCQYAGMAINNVSVYFKYAGAYTLFLYKGDEINTTELVYQSNYSASAGCWQDINIADPVVIDYTQDLWVVLYASSIIHYPAAYCSYSGNGGGDAAYFSMSGNNWRVYGNNTYSWMIRTCLTDGTYTYNLYRNGNAVATDLTGNTYTDMNLPNGLYDYHVTTNYFGGESDPSNVAHVQIGEPPFQTVSLSQGYNWFSTDLDITLDDLQDALVVAMPSATSANPIKITAQNGKYRTYSGNGWRGNGFVWDVNQMYIIQSPTAGVMTLQGQRLTPAVHPITIVNGYNWIGFPLDTSMSVSEAFAGFNAVANDKVTAQDGSTSTYRGTSWRNSFDLVPGQGYIFKSASFQTRTLTFPSLGKSVERKE